MRNSTVRQAFMAGIGIVLGLAATAAPGQADAAQLPGSCDLVRNTQCHAPGSLLDQILALFRT
jgi:hypothetical protein